MRYIPNTAHKVSGTDLVKVTKAYEVDSGGTTTQAFASGEEPELLTDFTGLDQPSWGIEKTATNLFLNSDTLVTQDVTVANEAYTVTIEGTGTVTFSGTHTGTIEGVDGQRVKLTFTPTAGTLTCTVSGEVLKGQIETGSYGTSYIKTGATTVERTKTTPVLNNFLPDTGWIGGVCKVVRDNSVANFMYASIGVSATDRSLFSVTTGNDFFYRAFSASTAALTIANPFPNWNANEHFVFGYVNFWTDTGKTCCLFDTVGNIYKFTKSRTAGSDNEYTINVGCDEVGARQTSQYHSAIESGEDAYSDATMIEIARRLTKADTRFNLSNVTITTP